MSVNNFDLKNHNRLYEEWHSPHGPNCLCKRFKDGEEMWKRSAPQQEEPPDDKKPDRDPEVRKLLGESMRKDEQEELGGKKFDQLFEL